MRTTITLDPDTEALVKRYMRERNVSFKRAVNEAIRSGLARTAEAARRTPVFAMGFEPRIQLDKALQLAGELEDEELIRRLSSGS